MDSSLGLSKKELLDQIAQEERLIRIHESELALAQRQQQLPPTCSAFQLVDDVEEQDWLETLDALQSSSTQKLEFKAQDDPRIHRLLPLVSGVTFTSVRALEPHAPQTTTTRSYQFQGTIRRQLVFTLTIKVELLKSRASIVDLVVSFEQQQSQELADIADVAKETRCIPLLFRNLAAWVDFDSRRSALLAKYQAVKRLSSDTFVLQVIDASSNTTLCSLEFVWKWKCSRYQEGREKMKLTNCSVSSEVRIDQSELAQCLREIKSPQGLNDLVESVGSCEKAIQLLIQVLLLG